MPATNDELIAVTNNRLDGVIVEKEWPQDRARREEREQLASIVDEVLRQDPNPRTELSIYDNLANDRPVFRDVPNCLAIQSELLRKAGLQLSDVAAYLDTLKTTPEIIERETKMQNEREENTRALKKIEEDKVRKIMAHIIQVVQEQDLREEMTSDITVEQLYNLVRNLPISRKSDYYVIKAGGCVEIQLEMLRQVNIGFPDVVEYAKRLIEKRDELEAAKGYQEYRAKIVRQGGLDRRTGRGVDFNNTAGGQQERDEADVKAEILGKIKTRRQKTGIDFDDINRPELLDRHGSRIKLV